MVSPTRTDDPIPVNCPELAADVSYLPRRQIGGVVRPQLITVVSVVRSEVDGVADEMCERFVGVTGWRDQPRIRTAPDVGHLPRRAVGGVVRPEFNSRAPSSAEK